MSRSILFTLVALGACVAPLLLSGCAIPTDKDKAELAGGFAQYSQRQFAPANRIASSYIQKFPNDQNVDEAYYLRGLARQGAGEKTGATQDLNVALAKTKRPDLRSKAHRALGDLAYDAQRWDDAITLYDTSIKESDGRFDPLLWERIGSAYQAQGRWDESRPYFQKIIEARPDPAITQRAITHKNARAFELQFGAYSDANNARNLLAALKAQGVVATLTSEMRDGKLWWLVRTGSFLSYAEAEMARKRYVAKHPTVIIVP